MKKSVEGKSDLQSVLVANLRDHFKSSLIKSGNFLFDAHKSIGVVCAFSKGRIYPGHETKKEYWFGLKTNFKQARNRYVALICGTDPLLIPFSLIEKDLKDTHNRIHIHIFNVGGKYCFSSGRDLSKFVIELSRNNPLSMINPGAEKDFWKFYRKNEAEVEEIISVQICKCAAFLSASERDDLHQDVLCRLYRCDVLKKYNPELASFNTFFTGRIRGYIKNWVTDYFSAPSWQPWSSETVKTGTHQFQQVYTTDLNGIDPSLESQTIPNFSNDQEGGFLVRDIIDRIEAAVPDPLKKIIKLLELGYNKSEIAEVLGATKPVVGNRLVRIQAYSRKVLDMSKEVKFETLLS